MHVRRITIIASVGTLARPQEIASGCTKPLIRKEWRTLSREARLDYISAIQCLQKLPARGTNDFPVISRFDDFVATHINQTGFVYTLPNNVTVQPPGIHENGVFLPWHRYFLALYEHALRSECGYTGAQPYWDWTLDTPSMNGSFVNSPIFDPITGFGGNGTIPDANSTFSCVSDGPFANRTLPLSRGIDHMISQPHCLRRNLAPFATDPGLSLQNVNRLLNHTKYWDFSIGMDNVDETAEVLGVHLAGHGGVGGEMGDMYTSPQDPLFYMHHANLDRLWWIWQRKKDGRVFEIGGPRSPRSDMGNTTLETVLEMYPFVGANVPAWRAMDLENSDGRGVLCNTYE
ncbi:Di-copper centre-containing protein [Microthyrium microscopicum]|uniref:Di-copper centre-containing protein n=1 Tax=Microthyrium microscopicum TaxID=703497 RepID=A0A6A6TY72_9PEZI|nr:Di-copper centre-containing protein [Microthyrium microscopicum]